MELEKELKELRCLERELRGLKYRLQHTYNRIKRAKYFSKIEELEKQKEKLVFKIKMTRLLNKANKEDKV